MTGYSAGQYAMLVASGLANWTGDTPLLFYVKNGGGFPVFGSLGSNPSIRYLKAERDSEALVTSKEAATDFWLPHSG